MSEINLKQSMTEGDRADFERGASLLKQLQEGKGFDDHWVPVGKGLLAIRRTVMSAYHLTEPKGVLYKAGLARMCNNTPYEHMHTVTRSNLLFCMEHLADIVELRAGWTPSERAKVNHPDTMAKRLREMFNRPPGEAPRRNASPMLLLKDKNQQLLRANADLEEQLAAAKQADGSLFDLKRDKADEIARVIVGSVSDYKAREIHKALGVALKAPKHAG